VIKKYLNIVVLGFETIDFLFEESAGLGKGVKWLVPLVTLLRKKK